MMSDDIPISEVQTCGLVKLEDLLFYVVGLKRRALNNNDKDLFEIADSIEHKLKLLRDKNTIFERW